MTHPELQSETQPVALQVGDDGATVMVPAPVAAVQVVGNMEGTQNEGLDGRKLRLMLDG